MMPDPNKYDGDKQKFMGDCMHQCVRIENKDRDQSIAQCLGMWRDKDKKKKCASDIIRELSRELLRI